MIGQSVCTLMQRMPGKNGKLKNEATSHVTRQNLYNPDRGGATIINLVTTE